MKNCIRIYLSTLFALTLCGSAGFSQKHPRELSAPKPVSVIIPKPAQFTLSNGIKVYYYEDRELPLITMTGYLRCGSLFDPKEKTGAAQLTGMVMRTGGTKTIPGDAMDEELEFLAASVESQIGQEYAVVNANCLKKDIKRVAEIYADVVMNPGFPQEKVDLAKNQMKDEIRRRWDRPSQGAAILFTEQIYKGTSYGARTTFSSLNAISRDDLVKYHSSYFGPKGMSIGIVGDISKEEAKTLLENVFGGWKKKIDSYPDVPAVKENADGTVYYAFKDAPQASVAMGHLGVKRNNPDEWKLEVMNDIFGGGGFTARLMKEIRSNRGLTYGIYGGVGSGRDRGVFRIASQLKAARSIEAVSLVKDMIKELQTVPVPAEELEDSKNALINSFVFRLESKDQLVSQFIQYDLNGYPADYLDTYVDQIRKVSAEDIQSTAKKYMDPSKMIITVVGDEKKFDKPLSSLGKVELIDYKQKAEADKAEK